MNKTEIEVFVGVDMAKEEHMTSAGAQLMLGVMTQIGCRWRTCAVW